MKYKLNNNGLAQGCAIPLKCEPISLTGAAILGGAELLGSIFGGLFGSSSQNKTFRQQKELMKYNQELGFENMRYQQQLGLDTFDKTFSKEASLNASLMRNSPTIQKEAMINAGINPASQFGNFSGNLAQSSVPTYTPQSGAPSAPAMPQNGMFNLGDTVSKIAELLVQTPLIKAKARDINADADRKEMENKGTVEENAWYAWAFDPRFDELQYVNEPKKGIDGYVLPESKKVVPRSTTRKGVEARELAKKRIEAELANLNKSISQDELAEMVANKQIANNEVVDALVNLPDVQYKEVMSKIDEMASHINLMNKQGELFVSQKELNDLEKEFSPKALMEKIFNHPFDPRTWFATVISLAIKRAFGRGK